MKSPMEQWNMFIVIDILKKRSQRRQCINMLPNEELTNILCPNQCGYILHYFEPSDAKGFYWCYRCDKEIQITEAVS